MAEALNTVLGEDVEFGKLVSKVSDLSNKSDKDVEAFIIQTLKSK
jgi:hypothetical protein